MAVELKVPTVGESVSEVFIGAWLKQEGDAVSVDEPLVEVETDKATVEVPASVSGTLAKVLKRQGESAQVGEVIAHLEEGDVPRAAAADRPAGDVAEGPDGERAGKPGGEAAAKSPAGGAPEQAAPTGEPGEARVMPAARRLLDEHGLKAGEVEASGPGGRMLKEDVQRHLDRPETAPAGAPETRAGIGGERQEESVPMSPLRRRIAERLVQAQSGAALLTTFNEIDMSQVMELRKEYRDEFEQRYGVRLGFMSFFVKAAIDALKSIPQLNAEIRDSSTVYKNYYDIGVAVSTPKGLVVPVLRNAERMSFAEVESAIGDFGKRAQSNKIAPEELQGGTFTISNGGVFGSLMSTPIVNPPQSGVLGMHSIQERPVAIEGRVEIRPMMYVALTYDHRIVDGREAVTFLKRIKEAIERPARMLLEV
jgi:2-oxoglutarate dehydrogenase E2 component (dihydrolipoamide succinyltransferase)